MSFWSKKSIHGNGLRRATRTSFARARRLDDNFKPFPPFLNVFGRTLGIIRFPISIIDYKIVFVQESIQLNTSSTFLFTYIDDVDRRHATYERLEHTPTCRVNNS